MIGIVAAQVHRNRGPMFRCLRPRNRIEARKSDTPGLRLPTRLMEPNTWLTRNRNQVEQQESSYLWGRTVTDRTSMLPYSAFEIHADIASENSSINARPFKS